MTILNYTLSSSKDGTKHSFLLQEENLTVTNFKFLMPIGSVITYTELEINDQTIDRLHDVTQHEVAGRLQMRDSTVINDMIKVPFSLFTHVIDLKYKTRINIKTESRVDDIELHGTVITDVPPESRTIIQHQWSGPYNIWKGITQMPLDFNHQVFMMYLYGSNQDKIVGIKLLCNGEVKHTWSSEDLRAIRDIEQLVMRFSEHSTATINFSLFDQTTLEIEAIEDACVSVVALNYNVMTRDKI